MKRPRTIRTHEIKVKLSDDELKQFERIAFWYQTDRARSIRIVMGEEYKKLYPEKEKS